MIDPSDMEDLSNSKELKGLVLELFSILDAEEESDSGRVFHPVYISSCRVMQTERLRRILPRMKELCEKN